MGGNLDRVYAVNPRHMRVEYPRSLSKLTDTGVDSFDDWPDSIITHINVRIRLAEVLRETVDALPLGSGDVETLPYSKIAALDKGFERILTDYPPFDTEIAPVDAVSKRVVLQRAVGFLSIQARRARFLRPFLQIKNMPDKFKVFRRQCLSAAQNVVETASRMLSETVATPSSVISEKHTPSVESKFYRSPYHSGLLINHVRHVELFLLGSRAQAFHLS